MLCSKFVIEGRDNVCGVNVLLELSVIIYPKAQIEIWKEKINKLLHTIYKYGLKLLSFSTK